jgi:hypothetical protein
MENKPNQISPSQHGAHSGSRSGLSDYNDGNTEQSSQDEENEDKIDGSVAFGNQGEEEDPKDDPGKLHSGL